jgi:23S rRNA (guanosine2251-2'-O)-methyltransferase
MKYIPGKISELFAIIAHNKYRIFFKSRFMRKLLNEELKRLSTEDYKKSNKAPVMIILDNIRSQQNIGSIFRTCDSFRLGGIHLCGITSIPPHREIERTALGATESVEWMYFESTKESVIHLKKKGYKIIVIEQTDQSIRLDQLELKHIDKLAIVFGNEISGVGEEILEYADLFVEIPQSGTKHSLNVSVSAGIVIWNLVCMGYTPDFNG